MRGPNSWTVATGPAVGAGGQGISGGGGTVHLGNGGPAYRTLQAGSIAYGSSNNLGKRRYLRYFGYVSQPENGQIDYALIQVTKPMWAPAQVHPHPDNDLTCDLYLIGAWEECPPTNNWACTPLGRYQLVPHYLDVDFTTAAPF